MEKRFSILCICTAAAGILIFAASAFLLRETSPYFGWCIGLGSALIVLGLGYLIHSFYLQMGRDKTDLPMECTSEHNIKESKERAGYLVCKIMLLLICIYIYILRLLNSDPLFLFLAIALVLIQYLTEFILLQYFLHRK